MNRKQKQTRLASEARYLALRLNAGASAFFGNDGITLYADGTYGDIIGYLIVHAQLVANVSDDVFDPSKAIATVLGLNATELPFEVRNSVGALSLISDDTKRAYDRRVPSLVKALYRFAASMDKPAFRSQTKTAME